MPIWFWVSYAALWLALLFIAVTMSAVVRQLGLINRRIPPAGARTANPGPDIGEEMPPMETRTIQGDRLVLGGRSMPTLLVFMSTGCSVCRDLAPALRSVARDEEGRLTVIIVSEAGREEDAAHFYGILGLGHVPVVIDPLVNELYRNHATPYAILLDSDGQVLAKGLVNHLEHLESLLEAARTGYATLDHQASSEAVLVGTREESK